MQDSTIKLPNADATVVAQEKICDYLLNAVHPDNGGKAGFFIALGFRVEDWDSLAAALHELARNTEVAKTFESIHGRKYVSDRSPPVAAWQVASGTDDLDY